MQNQNTNHPKVIIFGGSGFLGINLAKLLLQKQYSVCIVSRSPPKESGAWDYQPWDAQTIGDWFKELENSHAIVNLAGKSVDCIKYPDNCDLILRSRVQSTLLIGEALKKTKSPPSLWVQMSTAHIYGDPPETICTESSPYGYGLAPFVGQKWEAAFKESLLPNIRPVILRTSFVLGKTGGALPRLASIAKIGLGGKAGHGKQGISWIHEEDMNNIFLTAIEDQQMQGVYIATAPNPVSNAEFMRTLRKALRVPIGLPALSFMVRIGAPLFLNTDPELALFGRYCISSRLKEINFQFTHPTLITALTAIYKK